MVANKGLRSKTSNRKMWWSKTPQRAKPDCCFLEPEGANSARSSYRLLGDVKPFTPLFHMITILYSLFLLPQSLLQHTFASCLFLLFFLQVTLTAPQQFLFYLQPFLLLRFLFFLYSPSTIHCTKFKSSFFNLLSLSP